MAKYYLLNSTELAGCGVLSAGIIIDSDVKDIDAIRIGGGQLWPIEDKEVGAASTKAIALLKRGGNPIADGVMLAAAAKSLRIGAKQSILWALDGTGDATTWDGIFAFVEGAKAPLDIYVKNGDAVTIPARDEPYNLKGARFLGTAPGLSKSTTVSIADGAVLSNLSGVVNAVSIIGNATTAPCIIPVFNTDSPPFLVADRGGGFANDGSFPMIVVPDNNAMVFASYDGGIFTKGSGTAVVQLGASAGLFYLVSSYGISEFKAGNAAIVTGDVTSGVVVIDDGTLPSPLPPFTGFAGTTARGITQAVATTTATRPAGFGDGPKLGLSVFDSDLGKPIWWDGTQWVDATGTPA